MINRVIASLGLMLTLAAGTLGTAQAGEVQNRLNHQQARINQGVASGQLTRGESRRGERRIHRIARERNRMVRRDSAQGHGMTGYQYQKLNRQLNASSRQIYRTKHNNAHRRGAPTL